MQRIKQEKSNNYLGNPRMKVSAVNFVIDRLKQAMVDKKLQPGDYLPSELELANSLGVGKTSVREAVKMLEAMGVVEVRRGHGTFIPEHPSTDLVNPLTFYLILEHASNNDLVELRKVFETAYTLAAMEKSTPEDVAHIKRAVELFEEKTKSGTHSMEDDLLFHDSILECTKNPYLILIGKTINQLFHVSLARTIERIPNVAVESHKAILQAFVAKDPVMLKKAINESLKGWETNLDKN